MTQTPPLRVEVAADPAAPATIHAEVRRWLVDAAIPRWVVDDLLAASDEIAFETILVPGVRRIEVSAVYEAGAVRMVFASDRRRRELRVVPFSSDVEIVDDIGAELSIVRHVADSLAIRALPDTTIVEVTKAVDRPAPVPPPP